MPRRSQNIRRAAAAEGLAGTKHVSSSSGAVVAARLKTVGRRRAGRLGPGKAGLTSPSGTTNSLSTGRSGLERTDPSTRCRPHARRPAATQMRVRPVSEHPISAPSAHEHQRALLVVARDSCAVLVAHAPGRAAGSPDRASADGLLRRRRRHQALDELPEDAENAA